MKILFSDLDQTVIYSHRHPLPGETCVMEYLNGKEQSFIQTENLAALQRFCADTDCLFVPLTTRTEMQYARLTPLQEALGYRYALLCNGAVLYADGAPDAAWAAESLRRAEPYQDVLKAVHELMLRDEDPVHVHDVLPYLLYVSTENEALPEKVRQLCSGTGVDVLQSGKKLYCIPAPLSKGEAVRRFTKRFCSGAQTFAIGDSLFDVPMLQACGHAFAPPEIAALLPHAQALQQPFSMQEVTASIKAAQGDRA